LPIYYFEFSSKSCSISAGGPVKLRSLAAAHQYAVRLIALTLDRLRFPAPGWVLKIHDQDRMVVLDVIVPTDARPHERALRHARRSL